MNFKAVSPSFIDILIVDDHLDNLRVLSDLLESQGYRVRKAKDGKTALRNAEALPPDLILLDVNMPGLDGYEVCRQLKHHLKTQEVPIIFISAFDQLSDRLKGFKAGGVDYVSKPFQVEELLARVNSQLTIQSQKLQLQQEIERREYVEEILNESRHLMSSILNSCPLGIAFLKAVRDHNGQINYFRCVVVNHILAQAFGRSSESLVGQRILKSTLDEIFPELFESCSQVVETGESFQQELKYENQYIQGWYTLNIVQHQDGCLATILDITNRKEWEAILNRTNQNLYQQATLDGLTQVYNRRIFDLSLKQEWQRLQREKLPLSLILIDIDYFKRYNDLYGHQQGDRCLRQIAQAIHQQIKRPADLVARYGGEEFGVILPNTDSSGAYVVAKLIQQAIQDLKLPHEDSDVGKWVTASMGISSKIPCSLESPDTLVQTADAALYQAKEFGRNQMITAQSIQICKLP